LIHGLRTTKDGPRTTDHGGDTTLDYILTVEYEPGDAATEDRVQGLLFLSSCLGSTISERDGRTVVECYFAGEEERRSAAEMLAGEKVTLSTQQKPHVDWLQLYQQSLEPVVIGRSIVIVPDASIESDTARLRLVIPQERAFGTGSHESTALCLELIEESDLTGCRCLDIGTGSGILAIAMVKLGARTVVAFDNDFDTFGIIQRNSVRNEVSRASLKSFYGEPAALRTKFDLITINIIPEVIGPLLPVVKGLMTPHGGVIVSGITRDRRDGLVEKAERAGLLIAREKVKNEWWAAWLRR
jgi:ribosomal protein L11 methyltransferase